MVIHLDVLILENIIVNMFLIHITLQSVKITIKYSRLILAAIIGGMYVIVIVFPQLKLFTLMPFKLLIALIMICIAANTINLWTIIKSTMIFILYTMMLCGIIIFIEYNDMSHMIYGLTINDFSYKTLIIAVMVLYIILNRLVIFIKDRKEIAGFTYIVEVNTREGSSKIKAFLDTGNELKEPITNLPVIIVEKNMLKNLNIADDEKLLIPYKVINGSTGYIEAFKPLEVKIVYDNKKEIIVEAVIGLCDGKLSNLNDYNALLSRGII